jgi:subfamily B ATP-binding cassette protein MsbA
MKLYLRLIKHLRPYWLSFIFALVCMMAFALSTGAMAYLIGPAIKFLFTSTTDETVRLVPYNLFTIEKEKMIIAIPLALIVMAVTKGLSYYGNTYYMGYIGQRVVTDLRRKLYEHILRLPVNYFTSNPTGTLTSRLTNDVSMLQKTTSDALAVALRQVFTIAVLAAVIASMDWKLALIASIAFPLAVWPMIRFGRRVKRESKKGQVTMGAITSLLHEAIGGVRIVKAFGMEGYESGRFSTENERFAKYRLRTIKVRAMSTPLMETLGAVGFAATIWYAAYRINGGTLKPEDFISFFAALVMLYQPIKALNGVHLNLQQGLAAATRVFEVMDTPQEPLEEEGVKLEGLTDGIEYRNVSFGYGGKTVLEDINLRVKKGWLIAIVGVSGVGKTTLVNLLPRFYDVTGGGIFIDGRDIREFSLASLRSRISIVSQQVILFNDTVKGNIAYGDPARTDEEITRAAVAANAHEFIQKMAQGYDTFIGEGGARLSGGERQRISIARAILKDAPMLIMDEATSSLDTGAEMEVQKGLANLVEGRTTFVIAHRLSTIRNADRIVVLAEDSLIEEGRHEELLRRGGEYARLHAMYLQGIKEGIAT